MLGSSWPGTNGGSWPPGRTGSPPWRSTPAGQGNLSIGPKGSTCCGSKPDSLRRSTPSSSRSSSPRSASRRRCDGRRPRPRTDHISGQAASGSFQLPGGGRRIRPRAILQRRCQPHASQPWTGASRADRRLATAPRSVPRRPRGRANASSEPAREVARRWVIWVTPWIHRRMARRLSSRPAVSATTSSREIWRSRKEAVVAGETSRRIIAALEVSLDGLIEGPDGEVDWIVSWEDSFDLVSEIDTLVLGGGAYPGYEQYWLAILANPEGVQPLTGRVPSKGEVAYARFADTTPHVVLSGTLETVAWKTTRVVHDVADIGALKQQPGKDIHAVGGASLVSTLMNEGLVDQLRLTVHPVVLGKGKALFKDVEGRHGLELLETRRLAGGRVSLTYNVP